MYQRQLEMLHNAGAVAHVRLPIATRSPSSLSERLWGAAVPNHDLDGVCPTPDHSRQTVRFGLATPLDHDDTSLRAPRHRFTHIGANTVAARSPSKSGKDPQSCDRARRLADPLVHSAEPLVGLHRGPLKLMIQVARSISTNDLISM